MTEKFKITKINNGQREIVDDLVAVEIPLTLIVNDEELVTLLCSPVDLEDLARGFLFTSGIIKQSDDIKKMIINQEQWAAYIDLADKDTAKGMIFKRIYTSGCGRGALFYSAQDLISREKIVSDFKLEAQRLILLAQDFQKLSLTYQKTGGAHSAALADKNQILIFKEDIGRHNAVDKVIGQALNLKINFADKIIISSGRISSDLLFKAQKCKIPLLASKSAPTNQGVKLAQDMGITAAGFVRGNRMNIYSNPERII